MQINRKDYTYSETDIEVLTSFINKTHNNIDTTNSEDFLILENYLTDIIYQTKIDGVLLELLLPKIFLNYKYIVYNKMAHYSIKGIPYQFNSILFNHRNKLTLALGETIYKSTILTVTNLLLESIEKNHEKLEEWLYWYNTLVLLNKDQDIDIYSILKKKDSNTFMLSIIEYFSVFFFEKDSNILFSSIYNKCFFWSKYMEIDKNLIVDKKEFSRKYLLLEYNQIINFINKKNINNEDLRILANEIKKVNKNTFLSRREEFINKFIEFKDETYWSDAF